ncbi:MAG: LysM peptidoglycan-binding domain-containing protein [Cyanobacteria bacterium TGS_CYA1]|nr:LysM peptidoglycan-binding domain-containing protein [Cyanobacteria bacterium TGS_CYA1]
MAATQQDNQGDVQAQKDQADPDVTVAEPNPFAAQYADYVSDFGKNSKTLTTSSATYDSNDGFSIDFGHDHSGHAPATGMDAQATMTDTPKERQTRVEHDEIAALLRANPDMLPDFTFKANGSAEYTVQPGMTWSRLAIRALRFQAGPGQEGTFTKDQRDAAQKAIADYNGVTTDSLRIGQVIKIPPEFIMRAAPSRTKEVAFNGDSSVKVQSANATPEFTQHIAELYSKLPPAMRNLLQGQTRVIVAGDIRDYDPTMFTQRPLAHPPGMTFANVYGIHITRDGSAQSDVLIPEWYRAPDGKVVRNEYYKYAFNHEIGHALDRALAPGGFSNTEQFINAYQADFNRMTPEQRARWPYFTDGYVPGPPGSFTNYMNQARQKELFAELNAEILNTSLRDDPTEKKAFIDSFRTTFEHMVKIQAARNMITEDQYMKMIDNGFITPRLIAELQIIHRRGDLADAMRFRAGIK